MQRLGFPLAVYGTEFNPINAVNLKDKVERILIENSNKKIIAIDAASSEEEDIGCIFFKDTSIRPGAGMDKDLIRVGNYGLVGSVILLDDDPNVVFERLYCKENPFVEQVVNSIVGLLFRSYELGPTKFYKIKKFFIRK